MDCSEIPNIVQFILKAHLSSFVCTFNIISIKWVSYCYVTQQTQNICITFIQRRPNVFEVGPTLYNCYTNVLGLRARLHTARGIDFSVRRRLTGLQTIIAASLRSSINTSPICHNSTPGCHPVRGILTSGLCRWLGTHLCIDRQPLGPVSGCRRTPGNTCRQRCQPR